MNKQTLTTVIVLLVLILGGWWLLTNNQEQVNPPTGDEQQAEVGTITGSMGFPSEVIPEDIEVCAETTEEDQITCTQNRIESENFRFGVGYELAVAPGKYLVFERFQEGTGNGFEGQRAYYSEFVECGMSVECESHEPIVVEVQRGETATGVDPIDWYNRPPEDKSDEQLSAETAIEVQLAEKHNRKSEEVDVEFSDFTDTHAFGSVIFGEGGPGEGGVVYAARVGSAWQLIFDGNGSVACTELEKFDFPASMMENCAK